MSIELTLPEINFIIGLFKQTNVNVMQTDAGDVIALVKSITSKFTPGV